MRVEGRSKLDVRASDLPPWEPHGIPFTVTSRKVPRAGRDRAHRPRSPENGGDSVRPVATLRDMTHRRAVIAAVLAAALVFSGCGAARNFLRVAVGEAAQSTAKQKEGSFRLAWSVPRRHERRPQRGSPLSEEDRRSRDLRGQPPHLLHRRRQVRPRRQGRRAGPRRRVPMIAGKLYTRADAAGAGQLFSGSSEAFDRGKSRPGLQGGFGFITAAATASGSWPTSRRSEGCSRTGQASRRAAGAVDPPPESTPRRPRPVQGDQGRHRQGPHRGRPASRSRSPTTSATTTWGPSRRCGASTPRSGPCSPSRSATAVCPGAAARQCRPRQAGVTRRLGEQRSGDPPRSRPGEVHADGAAGRPAAIRSTSPGMRLARRPARRRPRRRRRDHQGPPRQFSEAMEASGGCPSTTDRRGGYRAVGRAVGEAGLFGDPPDEHVLAGPDGGWYVRR